MWLRSQHELVPGEGFRWRSGWRICFERPTDNHGWQYACGWDAPHNSWSAEPLKTSRVRRRMWRRLTASIPATSSPWSAAAHAPHLLLALAGGQQLIQGEMGGGSAALLIDLSVLSMRPCVLWGDEPPDALATVPPLLLAFHARNRTLETYHVATGQRLRTATVSQPLVPPPLPPSRDAVKVAAWLDAAMVEELGGSVGAGAGYSTANDNSWRGRTCEAGKMGCTGRQRFSQTTNAPPLLAVRGTEVVLAEGRTLTALGSVHLSPQEADELRRCEAALGVDVSLSTAHGCRSGAGGDSPARMLRGWLDPSSTQPLAMLLHSRAADFAARFEAAIEAAVVTAHTFAAAPGSGDGACTANVAGRFSRVGSPDCSMGSQPSWHCHSSDVIRAAGVGQLSGWEVAGVVVDPEARRGALSARRLADTH